MFFENNLIDIPNFSVIKQYKNNSLWKHVFFMSKPEWFMFKGNLQETEPLFEYATAVSEILDNSKKFIHVVGGELCSQVWNNKKIIDVLKTSKVKDICFVCGPKFDILNHEIIKLVKKNKIQLYYSGERLEEHYRVTDNGVFIEGYHDSFMPERGSIFCKNSKVINSAYEKRFIQLFNKLTLEDKVEANEILTKFQPVVYDSSLKLNYREPTKDELTFVSKL